MKELYVKLTEPDNFQLIQAELLAAIDWDYVSKGTHAESKSLAWLETHCPITHAWIAAHSQHRVRMFRYYITEPGARLYPHIDGVEPRVPFGINIVVKETANSLMRWFDCAEDNIRWFSAGTDYNYHLAARDIAQITLRDSVHIDGIMAVNNSVLHDVVNPDPEWRIMFVLRWAFAHQEPGDVWHD